MTSRDKVAKYLEKYPQARTTEIAKATKIHNTTVSTIRNQLQREAASTPKPKVVGVTAMAIDVGDRPAQIKLLDGGRVIGTLTISKDGESFRKSNSKKDHGRTIRWALLDRLSEIGML